MLMMMEIFVYFLLFFFGKASEKQKICKTGEKEQVEGSSRAVRLLLWEICKEKCEEKPRSGSSWTRCCCCMMNYVYDAICCGWTEYTLDRIG